CDVVFEDDQEDTLLDPVVIFEVLSHSTEAYGRGKKFAAYQTLASLQEYLLISQDQPRIEHFIRQPNGDWILKVAQSLEESVQLTSVPGKLPLAEVYDRVRFETQDLP
ncbi:MAG TPA: Uma2 family endonuclease, partial [Ardenticatenaceae bacterium]|nr:Uma2 family endonuclease [Ardenticatenaceae bacterium]